MIEERIDNVIRNEFSTQITEIQQLVAQKSTHFVLCYLDCWILKTVLLCVAEKARRQICTIEARKDIAEAVDKKCMLVVHIDKLKALSQQAVIYELLETSMRGTSLILVTNSCMAIDNLEKRVRSRLSHRTVFLKYLSAEAIQELVSDNGIVSSTVPTCEVVLKEHLQRKYKIARYELGTLYAMLSPLHLCIVVMCAYRATKHTNAVEEFRKFTLTCKELKRVVSMDVLNAYFDVLNSGLVDKGGHFLADFDELKAFVRKKAPLYVKSFLK